MSKDIVKRTASALGTVDDKTFRQDLSTDLVTVGGGGLVLYGAAALIPFLTVWMVLVAALAFGVMLKFKS